MKNNHIILLKCEDSVVWKYRTTVSDGKNYDAIGLAKREGGEGDE